MLLINAAVSAAASGFFLGTVGPSLHVPAADHCVVSRSPSTTGLFFLKLPFTESVEILPRMQI